MMQKTHLKPMTNDNSWSPENERRHVKAATKKICPFVKRKCRADCMAFEAWRNPCCVLAGNRGVIRV